MNLVSVNWTFETKKFLWLFECCIYLFSYPCHFSAENFATYAFEEFLFWQRIHELVRSYITFSFHFQWFCTNLANFLKLIFQGLWELCKLNYLTNMYMYECYLKKGMMMFMFEHFCTVPADEFSWMFISWFALVSWQCLCWGHITICWAMCIASVIPSPWGTTASTRLNDWTFIDTQIFTTVWTLMPNIFCTVCTKWNTTTSAR